MAIQGVNPACYILALFIRDDGERFLLGSGFYEFKEKQMHFSANTIENDTISVQGNDGYLLAGQVRRPGSQEFNGFVGDGTVDKSMVEQKRRDFFQFFRKNFFYKVIYVFPNGTAIQRKRGFLVDDPTVQELYQIYPQYHVALNFEDVNYYSYAEDDDGHEIYAKVAEISLTASAASGGLMWDTYGVIWEDVDYTWSSAPGGTSFVILNQLDMRAKIKDLVIQGDTFQQTYSGKNLAGFGNTVAYGCTYTENNGVYTITATANSPSLRLELLKPIPQGTVTFSGDKIKVSGITISLRGSSAEYIGANVPASYLPQSATTTADAYYVTFFSAITSGQTLDIDLSNFQIESGSQPTSYEPFVGGTASPNPDYPQDVNVVTGEQTVQYGKNLFKGGNADYTGVSAWYGYGVSTYTVSKGVYTLPQPYGAIAFEYDNLTVGQEYTISFDVVSTVSGACFVGVNRYNGASPTGDSLRIDATTNSQRVSFTFTATATNRIAFNSGSTASFSVSYSNIQLEKSATATSYEPYYSYDVLLSSKNFFDKNAATSSSAAYWLNQDGTISTSATNSGGWQYMTVHLDSSSYTLSYIPYLSNLTNDNIKIVVKDMDADTYLYNSWDYSADSGNRYSHNFTVSAAADIGICICPQSTIPTGGSFSFDKVQIETGSTATPYEPYVTPIELCKIGTYQDYIYRSSDEWYVHKEINKITLDGTQQIPNYNWRPTSTSVGWIYPYSLTNNVPVQNSGIVGPVISDKLVATSYGNLYNNVSDMGVGVYTTNALGLVVKTNDTTLTTTSAINSFLSSNPITVYYALATPTDTKITDSTLIDELNALGSSRLFVGENNVIVSSTGTNLPAPVQFKYVSAYSVTGAEWEEGGPSGPTTVSVDSIAQVFPVWEVKGPAVNPQLSVLTTGTTITYAGSITSSQTLVIDMFNKTATLNGTSVVGNVTGDWISFKPGTNRVVYTTGNADAQPSLIKWQEIVG